MCLGIPGQIMCLCEDEPDMAMVDVSGIQRKINIACVVSAMRPAEQCIGDWVLVHVGFAMSRIDEQEAQQTLVLLHELGELQAELNALDNGISNAEINDNLSYDAQSLSESLPQSRTESSAERLTDASAKQHTPGLPL